MAALGCWPFEVWCHFLLVANNDAVELDTLKNSLI